MKNNSNAIGSITWNSAGNLSKKEKRQYFMMLVKSQLTEQLEWMGNLLGLTKFPVIQMDEIKVPDSSIAINAMIKAESSYNNILLHHCYRTFYWAAGFGKIEKVNFDMEDLFVASILHDLGLAEAHNHVCDHKCFAVYGGQEIYRFALENGIQNDRAIKLYEAIGLHLNPVVNKHSHSPEAYLLSKGAVMDVIGSNYFKFPFQYLHDVHNEHPRNGFSKEIVSTMTDLNHLNDSRADLLLKWGFSGMAKRNKLDKLLDIVNRRVQNVKSKSVILNR